MSERLSRLKRSIGLFLFWASWLLWGLMLLVPFVMEADASRVAVTATALLVAAEISFAVSLLLLGRPFYQAFKERIKSLWVKLRGEEKAEATPLD
ncbi:transporter suffix domain-containing protein [Mariprofundus sp. KV]|uniref:transporter suffix domain-containing protein n=1 Tax=Mariprofundus sp. KV TaxID=2608715 RepID=UPI0015A4A564|nr:transporter suffix domain-containing protein [Mariprofundus sp. KV]NWF36232.1 transporter suffix domain-containing protein [Mariprofundus sp. KV]